jgi:uncharacterized iron-regulated protein
MAAFRKIAALAAILAVLGATGLAQESKPEAGPEETPAKPDPTLTLKIGAPGLKDKTMGVGVGDILAAASGKAVDFDGMIRGMAGDRFVYVGETHNSLPMHDLEFRVIQGLYGLNPDIAVGMEMLPVTVQETLNKWSLGLLTREEFIREVGWYVHWNFNFGYYEKIFAFAKEHRIPVYALNIPREIITKIRMRGWDGLTDEEKKFIPKAPDVSNPDHRTLIRTIFEAAEIPHAMKGMGLDAMFDGLYRAQVAWDQVMAANAVRGAASQGRRMVVCAGSGHLLYNLGINMRAYDETRLPYKTVIAVVVPEGRKKLEVERSYADYVVGLAGESRPAYPSVGLSFKTVENLENPVVESKPISGAAARADFERGDIILAVDGLRFTDINALRMHMAGFGYGDEIKFRILRDGQVKDVTLKLEAGAETEAGK